MKKEYINVDDGYWGVVICYDLGEEDCDEIIAIMDSFGLDDEKAIEYSLNVLFSPNGAMTISRVDLKMSVVFIGRTTTDAEFANSMAHELDHVQDAICEHYDVMQGSEPAAYLQGYLFGEIMRALDCRCDCTDYHYNEEDFL